jgi:hypothetical protein
VGVVMCRVRPNSFWLLVRAHPAVVASVSMKPSPGDNGCCLARVLLAIVQPLELATSQVKTGYRSSCL